MDDFVTQMSHWIAVAIPLATFLALTVSIILFAKNKGTIDALREAANTYKTLSESYKDTIDQLEYRLDLSEEERERLQKQLLVQQAAMEKAVDEIISGFKRAGLIKGDWKA